MADKQNELKLIRMNEVEATEIDWVWSLSDLRIEQAVTLTGAKLLKLCAGGTVHRL